MGKMARLTRTSLKGLATFQFSFDIVSRPSLIAFLPLSRIVVLVIGNDNTT
jgi:hypothetical protein